MTKHTIYHMRLDQSFIFQKQLEQITAACFVSYWGLENPRPAYEQDDQAVRDGHVFLHLQGPGECAAK